MSQFAPQSDAEHNETKWFEVWFHDSDPPYFLWVGPQGNSGEVTIFDLMEKKPAYIAKDYQHAYLWLREDDFEMVQGRETFS